MTVINLDNDERFKVNQVNVKFDGKEYSVVANDDTINKITANVKAFFANAKKYDDSTKKFENTKVEDLSSNEMDKTLDETIDFSVKQRAILIKAINNLFGSNLGDLLYQKKHSTKVLSNLYDQVIDELYETKANSQHEKMKKLVKKAKKVK